MRVVKPFNVKVKIIVTGFIKDFENQFNHKVQEFMHLFNSLILLVEFIFTSLTIVSNN